MQIGINTIYNYTYEIEKTLNELESNNKNMLTNLLKNQQSNKQIMHEKKEPLFYPKFKQTKTTQLSELIDNTFDVYKKNLELQKSNYEKKEYTNKSYSIKRYKNNISKSIFNEIKSFYSNAKELHNIDTIGYDCTTPYLSNLFFIIDLINASKYIDNEQFKNPSTQYTYENYENKTNKKIDDGENFDKEYDTLEGKLHKGLIETCKKDPIEGFLVIFSLQLFPQLEVMNPNISKDYLFHVIRSNSNFKKQFKEVNFTSKSMFNGFAHYCYWLYAIKNYKEFIAFKNDTNKRIKNFKPSNKIESLRIINDIKKGDISKEIKKLFNLALDKEEIKNIRGITKEPKILKYYDDIPIYTLKDISSLEEKTFNLFKNKILDKKEISELNFQEEEQLKNYINLVRPHLF